jgi:hypothetical protein
VHRFTYDGRYAYISTEQEGFIGTIVMILDLKDPTRPEEVGRWWMHGRWAHRGLIYPIDRNRGLSILEHVQLCLRAEALSIQETPA